MTEDSLSDKIIMEAKHREGMIPTKNVKEKVQEFLSELKFGQNELRKLCYNSKITWGEFITRMMDLPNKLAKEKFGEKITKWKKNLI